MRLASDGLYATCCAQKIGLFHTEEIAELACRDISAEGIRRHLGANGKGGKAFLRKANQHDEASFWLAIWALVCLIKPIITSRAMNKR